MSSVNTPTPQYDQMMEALDLPNTLWGGTAVMRQAGEKYLPKEQAETQDQYNARIKRTFLFNAFKRTVNKLAGEVFSKDIVLEDDVPEQIKELCEDIDLTGQNINRFGSSLFTDGIKKGAIHIYVDYPKNTGQRTIAEEKAAGLRPYFIALAPENLIGWRHEIINGKKVLSQIRMRQEIELPDADFTSKFYVQIKVVNRSDYVIYQEGQDKDGNLVYEETERGVNTLGEIPLASFMPGEPMSNVTAKSPVEDLAYLNLAHWQSSSDQRNILHFSRVPILFGKMIFQQGETVKIGPNNLIHANDPQADLKSVGVDPAPIDAGRRDLEDLERQMALFGLTLMLPRTGNMTATGHALDNAENDSTLKQWALAFKDFMEQALMIMAKWLKQESGGSVKVNTEFNPYGATDAQTLVTAFQAGLLPREVVINELKRRGTISDDLDIAEINAMLENDRRQSSTFSTLAGSILGGNPGNQPGTGGSTLPQ